MIHPTININSAKAEPSKNKTNIDFENQLQDFVKSFPAWGALLTLKKITLCEDLDRNFFLNLREAIIERLLESDCLAPDLQKRFVAAVMPFMDQNKSPEENLFLKE